MARTKSTPTDPNAPAKKRHIPVRPPGIKSVSKSIRAGLQFPVGRILTALRRGNYAPIVRQLSAVYMGAVLEYLTAEILELAGNIARDRKKVRINARHLSLAIRSDEELNHLLKDVTISDGGVIPHIHPAMLVAKKGHLNLPKSNKSSQNDDSENINPNIQM
uniref:Histone H2A n=1 Tax=Rhabditophanes sp. KR3021 TaxID=114890 RepID=A0AC35UHN2_9BILA